MRSALSIKAAIVLLLPVLVCPTGCATSESVADKQQKVLRVVPPYDLQILDPVWGATYLTRDHGFMVYDTLFGMDAQQNISPQMVDHYEVSEDKKTWTFTLRDGLEFHDGAPVTSDDVIASIERWGQRDPLGQKLLEAMSGWERIDDKTFRLRLKGAYGLVLDSLAKPDTYVPFILPKRLASTPASSQISDATGSGPFIFKKDEWSPGERVVYVRNPKYKPRNEPASGTAGGKVVKVDRVEWRILKDPQSQVNALIAGEVDIVVEPAFTLYPLLQASPGIQMVTTNPLGYFFFLRFNHVQKPFNDARIRQAAMVAMNQTEFLQAQVGLPEMFHTCFSIYPCATPLTSTEGMDFLIKPDIVRARQLLREAGYDGTPAIIMQPTDHSSLNKLPAVAAQTLREAGFNVVLESMDWNTLQARRVKETGWSIFPGLGSLWTRAIPVSANVLNPLCEKAWFGWPCDPDLERLRDAFAFAQSDEDRKRIATQVQVRAMQVGTHVPLGEYRTKLAARKDVRGFVTAPINAFWNLEKQ